jgi:environmental stress-induced protein Ves
MSHVLTILAEDVAPQAWRNGGGQTRELLVWPAPVHAAQAPSANQEWQLRISRADIEASGPFSAFPGVQRWFVVLSGKGVILHMPNPDGTASDQILQPGHAPLCFDGGLAPGCTLIDGPTQDLNLMARGGTACVLPVQTGVAWDAQFAQCGLYTTCSGTWTDGHQTRSVAAHSLLWSLPDSPSPMRFFSDSAEPHTAWWLGFTPELTP